MAFFISLTDRVARNYVLIVDFGEVKTAPTECVEWVRQAMEESFHRCRQHMGSAALRQAKNYNRLAGDPKYDVGDWVLLIYPPMAIQKLALKFLGPRRVIRKLGEVNYEIESPKFENR